MRTQINSLRDFEQYASYMLVEYEAEFYDKTHSELVEFTAMNLRDMYHDRGFEYGQYVDFKELSQDDFDMCVEG